MTMTPNDRDDQALEALFSAARDAQPAPSEDLMTRLAADADAAIPRPMPKAIPPRLSNWITNLFAASGLSGAAVLGVWFGFLMPDAIDTLSLTPDDSVALSTFLPGADLSAAFSE